MLSRKRTVSVCVRPLSLLDGSAVELAKSGRTTTTQEVTSQDNVATDCGESSSQVASPFYVLGSSTAKANSILFGQGTLDNLPKSPNPATFVLPPPPPVRESHPFPDNRPENAQEAAQPLNNAHFTLLMRSRVGTRRLSDGGPHIDISTHLGHRICRQESTALETQKKEHASSSVPLSQDLPTKATQTENGYITTASPHYVGHPWKPLPVKPLTTIPLPPPTSELESSRMSWYHTLHNTSSFDDAWNAYTELVEHDFHVHRTLLHRLVRIISRQRPKAHREYMCLLAVLKHLRAAGGTIHLHEWNSLISAARMGLRHPTVKQFEAALGFFRDMTKGRAPGTTLDLESGFIHEDIVETKDPVQPDIYTYTTLLVLAVKTRDMKCLSHARSLLERSGIPPNRFTHLALVPYFSSTGQPGAIRSTLLRLEQDNMQLGLDGINALLAVYGENEQFDVVMMIYRLLKHNLVPDVDNESENDRLNEYRRQLRAEEFIVVPDYLVPNEVTYTSMIQIMSYHGHLSAALTILTDMLAALNTERGAPLIRDADGTLKPTRYEARSAVFRALFLGFHRYLLKFPTEGSRRSDEANEFTLQNLQQIFDLFMRMPPEVHVKHTVFYWVIVAFERLSGGDLELVRDVWRQLEGKFQGTLGGNRLRRLKMSFFPEDSGSSSLNEESGESRAS
ncbi:hypothetical protein H0H92_010789 [Tricholoma furcatifolium]|nr:hypothetical protein H0H92_010789 [Tricholoma furcatifolium]